MLTTAIHHLQRVTLLTTRQLGKFYVKTATGLSQRRTDEDSSDLDRLYGRIDIEVKGHDPTVLNSYNKFLKMAADELDVSIVKVTTPPKVIERLTVLKSAHVHKKHRVQYETRTHYRNFELKHLTGSTADTFLEYLQRSLPEGVAMKVTRHAIEELPEHIRQPPAQVQDT